VPVSASRNAVHTSALCPSPPPARSPGGDAVVTVRSATIVVAPEPPVGVGPSSTVRTCGSAVPDAGGTTPACSANVTASQGSSAVFSTGSHAQ
jgi:hypothetical protein